MHRAPAAKTLLVAHGRYCSEISRYPSGEGEAAVGEVVQMPRRKTDRSEHDSDDAPGDDEVVRRQAARIYSDLPMDRSEAKRVLREVKRLLRGSGRG